MDKLIYYKAPPGWDENQPNPFSPDGLYGPEWSAFRLRDEDDDNIINGRPGFNSRYPRSGETDDLPASVGPYCYLIGRGVANIEQRLAEFLRYECGYGRKVIIALGQDTDADTFITRSLANTPERRLVRPDDPIWLVHSTSAENWEKIKTCGELRSLGRLRHEGASLPGIGLFCMGEPADYADYIMLGLTENIGPEHVVSSQQKGYVITEENTPYIPGVRLYFDCRQIIEDGLAVSDGLHTLKVHDHLPLDPYLVTAISVKDVDPNGEVEVWTPRSFLNAANKYFEMSLP
ncbi:MAG: hypothetical protein ACYC27_17485 [Armatimonadota bacterium]